MVVQEPLEPDTDSVLMALSCFSPLLILPFILPFCYAKKRKII